MGIAALLSAGLLVVLTDQASKILAIQRLEEGRLYVVAGRIGLRRVMNPRAGLIRLSDGQSAALWIFVIAVLGCFIMAMGALTLWFGIALGLVMGGASSNVYDRFARGSVVDFIAIRGWRTFNLADASMVAGTVLAWGALWLI